MKDGVRAYEGDEIAFIIRYHPSLRLITSSAGVGEGIEGTGGKRRRNDGLEGWEAAGGDDGTKW